jgi:uncharacterized protein YceH (UPF0502 family)
MVARMLGGMDLSAAELRVLGSLVEKQLTTPQQYPLTLNALTLACSQSSNRDPVVDYDEPTVEAAVTSVKTRGLARFVHPSHGRSALRYGHALEEALGLDTRPVALLAVLMLRGPQTLGELRARSERMVRFSDLYEIQAELDALAARSEPLVVRLPRAPGQKEERYAQLLGGAVRTAGGSQAASPGHEARAGLPTQRAEVVLPTQRADGERPDHASGVGLPKQESEAGLSLQVEAFRDEVAGLRAELHALRRDLDDLRAQLGA